MVQLFDPRKAEEALREAPKAPSPVAPTPAKTAQRPSQTPALPLPSDMERIKQDFRLFLGLLWRFLLNTDPAPIMLDFAWYLQHGPDRAVIMAFRGFSKSWIAVAYALWLLLKNPQEKILVVSGSLARATASTNWALGVITSWPLLQFLAPRPHQRSSSKAFDVGPATPEQSPSFHALGIGGQVVGFRATFIIPDDVETQQNSLTVTMREKNKEAVKEFDSVIMPGGAIKFLGTPHDEDSLYSYLGARGYELRVYPALFPTPEQVKGYGTRLAPYILQQLRKVGPSCVGHSTMPSRFTDDDLAKRRLSLGTAEFALQFMLDTSLSDRDKYPLKVRDLMVMSLDPRRGPESVTWTNDDDCRVKDLPMLGFEGDFYFSPAKAPGVMYAPYNRIVGCIDNSGRGEDETALTVVAELGGHLFLLALFAAKGGFEPTTLKAMADLCVKFRVQKVRIEANFGDGMFGALFRPILEIAWRKANEAAMKAGERALMDGGTAIEEYKVSNMMAKEKRILGILEPVTQQHRLVVDRAVIEGDWRSLSGIDGEQYRHRYSLLHQYAHLTRDRDSLHHDDRLDSLAGAIMDFADILGVDPKDMVKVMQSDRDIEEWDRLYGDMEVLVGEKQRPPVPPRAKAFLPQAR